MKKYIGFIVLLSFVIDLHGQHNEMMMFGDTSRLGRPFSKDPHVIKFQKKYLMYYSVPPFEDKNNPTIGWGIGIAESKDLVHWTQIGAISAVGDYEKKGLCAPSALVLNGTVHLFYQTYGNQKKDAICHAFSSDGIHFTRNPTNPIFSPTGDWNCGRAIDAEVIAFKNKYLLYFATRDSSYKMQYQGVASAPLKTDFSRRDWTQLTNAPILKPEYEWEGHCVEGASIFKKGRNLFMFYAGNYNNAPQQIGVAISKDGIHWERVFKDPFLPNGKKGEWNESESGHPHLFADEDGKTYLFFQGNKDKGKTWFLSQQEVFWKNGLPTLKK